MRTSIRIIYCLLCLLLFYCGVLPAQDSTAGKIQFEFLPTGLHFQNLKANYQEAKLGILYYPSNKNLKIDLGNSVDLVSFAFPFEQIRITAGIDFFAYALSTSFAGNRLQIDALDGLFGGNTTLSKTCGNNRFVTRIRILHNSAHLVDGHYDQRINEWIDNKKPIPYTKDFGELLLAYELNPGFVSIRSYGGISYATLIRPSSLKRWNYLAGCESVFPSFFGSISGKPASLFFAYHFLLNGEYKYWGNSDIMLGLKFGEWKEKGITLYAEYYSGQRRLDEYFRQKVKEFGIGFLVDFF